MLSLFFRDMISPTERSRVVSYQILASHPERKTFVSQLVAGKQHWGPENPAGPRPLHSLCPDARECNGTRTGDYAALIYTFMLHTETPRSASIHRGDLVIVYERHDSMKAVRVDPSKEFANRFGVFRMSVSIRAQLHSKLIPVYGDRCDATAELGGSALWYPCDCEGTQQGLGVLAAAESGIMDKGAAAQDTNTICSRHQPHMPYAGASARPDR